MQQAAYTDARRACSATAISPAPGHVAKQLTPRAPPCSSRCCDVRRSRTTTALPHRQAASCGDANAACAGARPHAHLRPGARRAGRVAAGTAARPRARCCGGAGAGPHSAARRPCTRRCGPCSVHAPSPRLQRHDAAGGPVNHGQRQRSGGPCEASAPLPRNTVCRKLMTRRQRRGVGHAGPDLARRAPDCARWADGVRGAIVRTRAQPVAPRQTLGCNSEAGAPVPAFAPYTLRRLISSVRRARAARQQGPSPRARAPSRKCPHAVCLAGRGWGGVSYALQSKMWVL